MLGDQPYLGSQSHARLALCEIGTLQTLEGDKNGTFFE